MSSPFLVIVASSLFSNSLIFSYIFASGIIAINYIEDQMDSRKPYLIEFYQLVSFFYSLSLF